MGLPEWITYQDDRYPFIVLAPIGRDHKQIRSIGHKFERGVLSRLNDAIEQQINQRLLDVSHIRNYLGVSGKAILPVSFEKEGRVYPHLLRPELFLWRQLPEEDGLPIERKFLYETDFTQLSSDQLDAHVNKVIDDYLFLAEMSKKTRTEWLAHIMHSFHQHPIVQLAHEKREVIESVEVMNQSVLLSLLKYPEDIAHWRHRVEIVMRPYRHIPDEWLCKSETGCHHQKRLIFDSRNRTISCFCETCNFWVFYQVDDQEVNLVEEFDADRSRQRMVVIEKQFNDIAKQNPRLLEKLQQLKGIKKQLSIASHKLDECLNIIRQIERYQQQKVIESYPLVDMYDKLTRTYIPERKSTSELLWLSGVELDDVHILKELPEWSVHVPEDVYPFISHMLEKLNARLEDAKYKDDDIIITIKGYSLTYIYTQQVLDLIYYYGTDYPAHTLVQVLAGKATNKIRTLHLNETRWFGLLADWPEKYIQHLFNQLKEQGWLNKHPKGYSVSDFAEEVM